MKFKLKKINRSEDPLYETSEDWSIETNGWTNKTLSPWIGYEVEGYGRELPLAGKSFCMNRTKRNGEEVFGIFHTSIVMDVKFNMTSEDSPFWTIQTLNSIYRLEVE